MEGRKKEEMKNQNTIQISNEIYKIVSEMGYIFGAPCERWEKDGVFQVSIPHGYIDVSGIDTEYGECVMIYVTEKRIVEKMIEDSFWYKKEDCFIDYNAMCNTYKEVKETLKSLEKYLKMK
jgi:hypothetical protein